MWQRRVDITTAFSTLIGSSIQDWVSKGKTPAISLLWQKVVGAALRVFIIMTSFTDRYHDILYS
jgi:hypothetical protein